MSDQESTPVGRVLLAGEVSDAERLVPVPLHTLPGIVISLVTEGVGFYRHADRRTEARRSIPGRRPLGEPHWYGTRQGRRWSERFAVVDAPAFDLVRRPVG